MGKTPPFTLKTPILSQQTRPAPRVPKRQLTGGTPVAHGFRTDLDQVGRFIYPHRPCSRLPAALNTGKTGTRSNDKENNNRLPNANAEAAATADGAGEGAVRHDHHAGTGLARR